MRPIRRHSFDTVLGSVQFDANGDSIQQFVTIHKVDMGANGGAGDWVILRQRDYGPPPIRPVEGRLHPERRRTSSPGSAR